MFWNKWFPPEMSVQEKIETIGYLLQTHPEGKNGIYNRTVTGSVEIVERVAGDGVIFETFITVAGHTDSTYGFASFDEINSKHLRNLKKSRETLKPSQEAQPLTLPAQQ